MEDNNSQNIRYIKSFMIHFMLFIMALVLLIWIGNYLLSNIPWIDVIIYLWGSILVTHAFLVFGLMGLFGNKVRIFSLRIDRFIAKHTKI